MATPNQTQMRAARLHDRNDVRVETVSVPVLLDRTSTSTSTSTSQITKSAGEDGNEKHGAETTWLNAPRALVQVEWCGICGSDLHMMAMGEFIFVPSISLQYFLSFLLIFGVFVCLCIWLFGCLEFCGFGCPSRGRCG